MLVELEEAERAMKEAKQELDRQQQLKLEKQAEIDAARNQLAEVESTLRAMKAQPKEQRETIDHYPTPIAKTVFSEEVHFQLKGGRLVHVPLESLTDRMKAEWKVKAEKLRQLPKTVETVPEIGGFRMQYELAKIVESIPTEFGSMKRESVEFQQFVLIPVRSTMGEPLETALADRSDFQRHLSDYDPAATTVSVWVYPDSYASFQELKDWLHGRGFRAAAWPLPEGALISGSPSGLRSSAQ